MTGSKLGVEDKQMILYALYIIIALLVLIEVGLIASFVWVKKQITKNQKELIKIMSSETSEVVDEIKAAKDELVEAIAAERAEVTAKLDEVETQNQALSEQIEALENEDDVDLEKLKEIRDGIKDSVAGVKGIFDNSPVQPSTPAAGGGTAPLGEDGGQVDAGDGTGAVNETEQP